MEAEAAAGVTPLAAEVAAPIGNKAEGGADQPAGGSSEDQQNDVGAQDADGLEKKLLSFREHMWDGFDVIWKKRVEPTRRQLEVLVASLRERAQLERQYGKGLLRIAGRMQAGEDEDETHIGMDAICCNLRCRGEQATQLADDMEQDVVATVDQMLRQHSEVSKKVFTDGQRLTKHWQEARGVHEQWATKYAQTCVEAEEIARECLRKVTLQPVERKQLSERCIISSRYSAAIELEYQKAVQRRDAAADLHRRQMGIVLNCLQDMEEKRALCFHDTAMKIAVYDTSWLRNVQYDLDSCVQAIEAQDACDGLQNFVSQHQSQAPPLSPLGVQPYWELSAITAQKIARPDANGIENELSKQLIVEVSAIRPLLTTIFDGNTAEGAEHQEAMSKLVQNLSASKDADVASGRADVTSDAIEGTSVPRWSGAAYRSALCVAILEDLQHRATTAGTSEPSEHAAIAPSGNPLATVRLTAAGFDAAVALFMAALDGCDKDGDAWNGRDLMLLSQAVASEAEEGRGSINVLLRVYSHPLWSRVTFWEDLLLVGVAEAHSRFSLSRSADAGEYNVAPSALDNAKGSYAPMTPFLHRYISYMVTFGIKAEQAQGSAQRTLKKHTALLGQHAQLLGQAADSYAQRFAESASLVAPAQAAASQSDSARLPNAGGAVSEDVMPPDPSIGAQQASGYADGVVDGN